MPGGERLDHLATVLPDRAAGTDEALAAVRRVTGELADVADTVAADAERVLTNARRALRTARVKATAERANGEHDAAGGRRRARLARAVNDLADLVEATRTIVAQTRQRLAGQTPDRATRRVSLHDPDARPIAKGRLGKPVEFGHQAQLADNDDAVVLDYTVERGNPADAPQLAPAVQRITRRTGRPPRTVTADRGYGEHQVDQALHDVGVRQSMSAVGVPPTTRSPSRSTRRTVKSRTGIEGRISTLKRGYGWDRTRINGTQGARIWTGHGVLTHNLIKISALAA